MKQLIALAICLLPLMGYAEGPQGSASTNETDKKRQVVAQSEQFIKDTAKERKCNSEGFIAAMSIRYAFHEIPKGVFYKEHPIYPGSSDGQKKRITNIVNEAYSWKQTPPEFVKKIYDECMASN